VLEELLVSHQIGPRWSQFQIFGDVRENGLVLLLHSVAPVGMGECATNRGPDWRQHQRSSGGELQIVDMLGDPGSMTCDHRLCDAGVTSHNN
jgi:hypothetical protein